MHHSHRLQELHAWLDTPEAAAFGRMAEVRRAATPHLMARVLS
jgi:hypothetical protein